MSVVIVMTWLASGQPAVDLMEAQQCAALMAMTKQSVAWCWSCRTATA